MKRLKIKVYCNGVKKSDLPQILNLLGQLSTSTFAKNRKIIQEISHWREVMKKSFLINVRDMKKEGNPIVGMATLIPHIQSLGRFGNIQDVIVDEQYRGCGVGAMLWKEIVKISKENNFSRVDLTSSKPKAQKWYKKLGFEEHKTKFFRKYL